MTLVQSIPEYAEAVRKERASRDAAFLGITETVGAFELRAMTLRDFILLRNMRSPVLLKMPASPEELTAFLWLLSSAFRPGWTLSAWLFRKAFRWFRCRRLFRDPLFMAETEAACWDYVDETFQDSRKPVKVGWLRKPDNPWRLPPIPAPAADRMADPEYYSDACYFTSLFARIYGGWTPALVMDLPMKAIFQFQNEIRETNGGQLQNPSDAFRMGDRHN